MVKIFKGSECPSRVTLIPGPKQMGSGRECSAGGLGRLLKSGKNPDTEPSAVSVEAEEESAYV